MFHELPKLPADPILALADVCRSDPRPDKIDLTVGVYRDERGMTPVLATVKAAERTLAEQQDSKSYLSPLGDLAYIDRVRDLALRGIESERFAGIQTPGGGGALRLAAETIALASPLARVFVGMPTWSNHLPIFEAVGLQIVPYKYYDVATQDLRFDEMCTALGSADRGDIVLLHGACHNPSGADLDPSQWQAVARLISEGGLVPLVDFAYQGLGDGLDQDRAGLRVVLSAVEEGFVAYSCSKNFGLYRERTGALFAFAASRGAAQRGLGTMASLARINWSMPPDHGAGIVRTILSDDHLRTAWRAELDSMRGRISSVRNAVAQALPEFPMLGTQRGMFATLPLSTGAIDRLRNDDAIYIVGNGRINLAGLSIGDVPRFVDRLRSNLT